MFVGTGAANRLMARFGPQGEAGITFLIGHEMGHHIQNINGRFLLLNHLLAHAPAQPPRLVRRFELEADCYAGVWIHSSEAWASSDRFRAQLYEVLRSIGDENMREDEPDSRTVRMARRARHIAAAHALVHAWRGERRLARVQIVQRRRP